MKHIVDKVFQGYNNHYDLKNNFYNYLSEKIRNEPNKIKFLNKLKKLIKIEFDNHNKKCEEKDCGYPKLKDVSIKIIDSLIVEKKEQNTWFKKNIHYVYYTFGVIAFIYAFINVIYPFLIKFF